MTAPKQRELERATYLALVQMSSFDIKDRMATTQEDIKEKQAELTELDIRLRMCRRILAERETYPEE